MINHFIEFFNFYFQPICANCNGITVAHLYGKNILKFRKLTIDHTGSYSCDGYHSIQLEVIEMAKSPIITDVTGKEIKSVLKATANEIAELNCSYKYYKQFSSKFSSVIRWKVVGIEKPYDMKIVEKVSEDNEDHRNLVTISSNLRLGIGSDSPNVSIYCEVFAEIKKNLKSEEINIHVSNSPNSNQIISSSFEFKYFQSNLLVIITVTLVAVFALGIVSFFVICCMKNRNLWLIGGHVEIRSVLLPDDIKAQSSHDPRKSRLMGECV